MAHRTEYPPEATLQWTDRQRQVLDLLARGLSNAEIADRLGVSLAGAKWHVSEVISKLGVDSREEVADYWREHRSLRSRARRSVHGLFGLLSLKALGGAAAATAVAGAAAVGIVIVSADGGDERPLTVEASPTPTEPPTPTLSASFVPEVPAPDWWVPPRDMPFPDDAPSQPRCQTGWGDAVGFALLEVPGNEYYFVVTPSVVTNQGGATYACLRHAGRVSYAWDAAGNLLEDFDGFAGGGGGFEVDPDAPPSCGYSGASGSMIGHGGPISLPIHCSVPLNVAYAVVDDGTAERVEALDMPSVLGFPRKAIVAGHSSTTGFVIEFFAADGTMVERTEFSMPGNVELPSATPTVEGATPASTPNPADFRPAGTSTPSTSGFVPAVEPPAWFTTDFASRYLADELCGEFDDFIGVDAFEFEGETFYVVLNPDPPGPFTDPDTVCLRHYTRSGGAGGGSYHVAADHPAGCGFASGGPPPHLHFVQCSVPLGVAYAIFDDGSPARADAIDFPSTLGLRRRGIFSQASSSDGAMTIYLYDADDALIEALEYFPLP